MEPTPPSLRPPSWKRWENQWPWRGCPSSHRPQSTTTRAGEPVEFCQLHSVLLVVVCPSLLRAQLKETYGPRLFSATDMGLSHVKRLTRWSMVFWTSFLFTVKITSDVLSFNRDTLFTQPFNEECAVVFAVDFYFICKLCVLRAMEYWKAIHPGLLADTEYVWLQIVWITVDYWTAIQMCAELTVGISTKGDYLVVRAPRK